MDVRESSVSIVYWNLMTGWVIDLQKLLYILLSSLGIDEELFFKSPEDKQKRVEAAAKMANAHDFIMDFPDQVRLSIASASTISAILFSRLYRSFHCTPILIFTLTFIFPTNPIDSTLILRSMTCIWIQFPFMEALYNSIMGTTDLL